MRCPRSAGSRTATRIDSPTKSGRSRSHAAVPGGLWRNRDWRNHGNVTSQRPQQDPSGKGNISTPLSRRRTEVMHDTATNDPRLVWQRQGREHPIISVEEVRLKAQIAGRKVWRNLVIASVLALLLLVLCSLALISFSGTRVRMIASAMMLLTVVVVCKT